MMSSVSSDEFSSPNLQKLGLISSKVWAWSDSEDVLNAHFRNSYAATLSGQDRDAILEM